MINLCIGVGLLLFVVGIVGYWIFSRNLAQLLPDSLTK